MGFFRFIGKKHAYTGVDVPWRMDDAKDAALFRYLRGGGVRAFGCTSEEAQRARRQNRFLAVFGVLALTWLVVWCV